MLKKRAEDIINLVNKTESDIARGQTFLNGDIYIGCGESDGMSFIAQAIKTVQDEYPDITFHLHSGNGDDISDRLDKGLIDFGILIGHQDISKYHYLKLPMKDVSGVLMKRDSPLANKKYITTKDLVGLPLIVSAQELNKRQIPEYLLDDEKYHIVATYNLIFNASLLVREGVGYALGLDKIINTDCNSELCFKPLYPEIQADIIFVWSKYQRLSKSSQYFLNTIKEMLKKQI